MNLFNKAFLFGLALFSSSAFMVAAPRRIMVPVAARALLARPIVRRVPVLRMRPALLPSMRAIRVARPAFRPAFVPRVAYRPMVMRPAFGNIYARPVMRPFLVGAANPAFAPRGFVNFGFGF